MPTITINKNRFLELLSKKEIEDLEEKIFDFGLELENDENDVNNIKIEIPANRYDLLSIEGLSTFFGKFIDDEIQIPNFELLKTENPEIMINKFSSKKIRPIVIAGIIRGINFTEENYNSFIDLQDKLHHNLGRKRTIVSIGTHDLSTIKGPFTYSAEKPEDINFIPLNQNEKMDGKKLINFYKEDNHIKNYLHIIENSEVFPVIKDVNGVVLSLPPLINSNHSKITLDTKDVFIEVTATDLNKANIGLKNILCAFSIYSSNKFKFEAVKIKEEINEKLEINEFFSPIIEEKFRKITTNLKYLNRIAGLKIQNIEECKKYLLKMGYNCKILGEELELEIPIFRGDVLHACDVAEDLAISFGYNNIIPELPPINKNGKQLFLNKLTDLMRQELCFAGYKECLTFALCSKDDLTKNLLKKEDPKAVTIENPKTVDFQVGRTTILPGLLKTLSNNKGNRLPIKLFEISDVVHLDEKNLVGAKNVRNICALLTKSNSAGLDKIHGLLDLIIIKLNLKLEDYTLKESNHSELLINLQSDIFFENRLIGKIGIINPDVLLNYNWNYPASYLELNFEELINNNN